MKKIILFCFLLFGVLINGNAQCWKNIATGDNHSLSIREDGTLWAWGFNSYGQVGDGTTTQRPTPVQIGTANNWKMVSAGTYYSMGIKTDGTLWAWGYNASGQHGDGTTVNKSVPTQIGSATDWSFVNLGGSHTIAIKTNGTLWTWGANAYGQLGDGTTIDKSIPSQIGAGTNWKSASGGDDFTLAIQNNGTLWGFGRNNFGQLGDGTTLQKTTPTQINASTNWLTVECAQAHSLALKTDGTLWSWGYAFEGALGLGGPTNVTSPAQVNAATNWKSIGVQYRHSIATKTDGTLWAFGYNANGQLGDGTTVNRSIPVQIGASTNWTSVAPGSTHSNALRTDGSLWGTGMNSQGQFGDGTTASTTSFVLASSPQGLANASATPVLICPGGTSTLTAAGILALDQASTSGNSTGFWMSLSGQQSFIAGLTGVLTKVRIHTGTYASAATITVRIYSGSVGSGSMLTSVSYGKGTNINSWDDVILPNGGVSVTAAMPYYIEILGGSQVDWIYSNVNAYANGQAWRGGTSYNYDYNFETYIDQNTYSWNPGSLTVPQFTTSPGATTSYTATVTSLLGCVNKKTVTLNVNPIINAVLNTTNVSCNGLNNGAIDLIPTGGTLPYIYSWSNSQTTQDLINLPPGSYNVTITDANGCTKAASGVVTQPALLNATSAITTSINCNGGTGVVSVTGSGGTPPYTGTGSFTVTAGTYTYNVTDANGCLATTIITVTQPAPFTINVNASSSICFGSIANLTATGGSTYTWSPGGMTGANVAVSPVSTTVYTATGTSSLGCIATNTTGVTVNPNPSVTVSSSTICFGAATTLTASGATTYSWNTGATTSAISVSPGSTSNYTVTGTNGFGCTNTKTTSVIVNSLPVLTIAASPTAICIGSNATLTGTGATTYTWNPGALTGSATVVSPGSTTQYTVTGTNSNGCVNTQTIDLIVNPLPILTVAASPSTICVGATSTLTGTGASTYTWNPGVLTGSATVVSPGSTTQYTLTGTNSNGCVNSQTVSLMVNPLPTLTVVASPATICVGATSTLTGTGALTYTWNPGALTGSATVVSPGSTTQYTVTGTNSNGCINSQTVNLTVNPLPILTVAASPATICVGATSTLTGTGASTYTWNPGVLTGSATVVSPGTNTQYTITGTNGNGCVNTQTLNLTVNPLPVVTAAASSTAICVGSTATLTGSGANTYTWNPGALTGSATVVSPGATTQYTVAGTNSNGCINTQTITLTVNSLPGITAAASPTVICAGATATLTGNGALSYTWSPGAITGSVVVVSPGSTTQYTVTGSNSFGCVNNQTVSLTVNSLPLVTAATSTTSICAGGTATLTGTGASSYTWNPGSITGASVAVSPTATTVYTATGTSSLGCVASNTTALTVNLNPTVTVSSSTICIGAASTLTASGAATYSWNTGAITPTISVSPGSTTNYTVTGTNGAGCVNTKTTSVTVNSLPIITASASPTAICVGATATLTSTGATTYTWNPGALTGSATVVSPGATVIYTVTGTNGNGCVNTQTVNLVVNPLPSLTVAASPATICVGATSTLTGTGALTYTWNPGALTGSATVVSPGSTTQYTVTGTNGSGCVTTQTINLTVNPLPTLTVAASPATICVGATATLTGTGASTYTWNPGALTGSATVVSPGSTTQYTVAGTNGNGCVNTRTISLTVNSLPVLTAAASPTAICVGATATLTGTGASTYTWNPGAVTGSATVVSPGSTTIYTITGTNGSGCVNTQTVSLTVNSLPIITTAASPTVICVGSTATLTGAGASTYTWNPGALTGSATVVSPGSTTIYSVTGINSNGCVNTQTVSLIVNSLPVITAAVSPAAICAGATATLTGTGASTYTWSPGTLTGSTAVVSPGSTTIYSVTGTNSNGCIDTQTVSLIVNSLPVLAVTASPATICIGSTATLTGTGASTYTWNPGVLTGSAAIVSPGSTTQYTVTGTDGNNCVSTETVNITVNSLPVVTAVASSTVICVGSTATLTAGGASTYMWDTGASTAVIAVSPPSSIVYTVTGTDGNNCVNSETIAITVNSLPVVTVAASSTAICVGSTATLTAGGANTYVWDTGASTGVISVNPSSSTTYTVTGTDGNNCVNTETVSLMVNPLPVVTALTSSTAICAGETATLTAAGATTYTWNPGLIAGAIISVNPASSTIYTVTGENGTGCVNTETLSLIVNALPIVTANSTASAVCSGQVVTLNGTGALSYAWNNSVVDGVAFVPGASGTYIVTGTDVNGCVGMDTIFVTVNSLPVITAASTSTAVCSGDFASLTGSGAVTYTWNPGALTAATVTVNPSSNTIYTLSGTDGSGCVNTETISLTVNPLPVVNATASPTSICMGQTSTLSTTGAVSYTWNPGGLTGSVISVSPSSTMIYTVTGVDGSGCANSVSVALSVNVNPTVTVVSSPSVICEGQSAIITAGGATGYLWDTGANTFSISVSPASTSVYTVTGTNGSNCTHTETVSLTVNANPTVTIGSSSPVICVGQTSTLTANGANTYLWNTGAVNSVIAVSPVSTIVYTVTGTNSTNCVHTETIGLVVNALPAISVSPSGTTVCQGQSQLLQAFGATSYTWSGTGSVTNSVTVSPTVTTIYTITGTDANSCANTATAIVNTVNQPVVSINSPSTSVCMGYTMIVTASGASNYAWSNGATTNSIAVQPFSNTTYSVIGSNGGSCPDTAFLALTVLPLPSVSSSASNTLICGGNTVSLTAGGTAINFLWQPGNLIGATQVVQMNAPTTFTVYGQGANGCAFFNTTFVDVPSPSAITPVVTPTAICAGDSAILSVIGATVSLWSTNTVPNTSVVMPFANTTYTVNAVDINGCTSDISFNVLIKADCDAVVVYNGFTPNGDGVNDFWLIDNIEKFPNNKVFVYNRWGNKIFQTTNYNNTDNTWDGKSNGQAISSGTYIYIIVDESEKLIKKGWLEITN